jgi:hypothetical protein
MPVMDEFFAPAADGDVLVPMRLLRRGGKPFMLLPMHASAAGVVLSLYEPQRALARAAAVMSSAITRLGLVPGEATFARVPAPLAQRLREATPDKQLPPFGALLGNPNTPGRRFVILTCLATGSAACVIKAGFTPEARTLIQREAEFLVEAGRSQPGLPSVRALRIEGGCAAFTLDFVAGRSPQRSDDGALPALLGAWMDRERTIRVIETAAWRELAIQAGGQELFHALNTRLGSARVHPALQHGDFAPWNVKVGADGRWLVLDWERGEAAGLPLWDWLHYVIQRELLVARRDMAGAADIVATMLDSAEFKEYTAHAGCAGLERDLTLGYLLHLTEVLRPTEGAPQGKALLTELQRRWVRP